MCCLVMLHASWTVLCFSFMFLHAASSDATARLWSVSTGEDMRVYQGHHKATVCCALHDGADTPSWIEAFLIGGLSSVVFFSFLVLSFIVEYCDVVLTNGTQTLYACTVTNLCYFSSYILFGRPLLMNHFLLATGNLIYSFILLIYNNFLSTLTLCLKFKYQDGFSKLTQTSIQVGILCNIIWIKIKL